jgi:hypothetical protein
VVEHFCRYLNFFLAFLVFITYFAPPSALAIEAKTEVPAGKTTSVRLRNTPEGALVSVEVKTDGDIAVLFVDSQEKNRVKPIGRPLFHSQAESDLSFSVTIPKTGTYFIVFDNRKGDEPRSIEVTVRALRGNSAQTAESMLRTFEQQMHKVFVFDTFAIRIAKCGKPNAFSSQAGIVLCAEYAQKLFETLGDKTKASNAFIFTLFHEMGHVLLGQWKYPFFDNEDVADEFATAVMVMMGQKERARSKAEFFAANPSKNEALSKLFRDDRHPVSPQRARNILRWVNDPQLVRKWQPVLVPHMQTNVLESLQRRPNGWTDPALVEKELAARH